MLTNSLNPVITKIKNWKPLPYFSTWVFFRLFSSINAVVFSNAKPDTPIEKIIAVWPPSANIGSWLYRILLAPWLRWDAVIYTGLVTSGYAAGDGFTVFHPLYVLLSKPLNLIGVDPLLSLIITSSLATLGFFWLFYQLARIDLPAEKSLVALLLLASFPISIVLFFPYTESVFLFFAALAFYQMEKRNWFLVGLAAYLASLTRQQGVLLIFPILWYGWEDSGKSIRKLFSAWPAFLAATATLAGLFTWTIYRLYFLNELGPEINSLQGFFYTILLSPSARNFYPDQALLWPWNAFLIALPKYLNGPGIADIMNFALALCTAGYLVLAWKYLRPAYRLYSLAIVFVSFGMSTGSIMVYLALARHLFLAFPIFIGLARVINRRWQFFAMISLQLFLQTFMLFLYVTRSWIP